MDDGHAGSLDERLEGFGNVRFGADAEHDVPCVGTAECRGLSVAVQLGVVDLEQVPFGVPAHRVDLVAEPQSRQVLGDPAAVGVVFGALDVESLGEVERIEPVAGPEVVQERPGALGVGERHQVGQEGDLDGGAFDEQSRVPVEGGALFVEDGVQFGEGVGEGGEGEVGGSDADADEVAGGFGFWLVVLWGRAHAGACPSGSSAGSASAVGPVGPVGPVGAASSVGAVASTSFSRVARSSGRVWGLSRVALSHSRPSSSARPMTALPSWSSRRRTAATASSDAPAGRKRTVLMVGRSWSSKPGCASTVAANSWARAQTWSTRRPIPVRPRVLRVTAILRMSGRRVVRRDRPSRSGRRPRCRRPR